MNLIDRPTLRACLNMAWAKKNIANSKNKHMAQPSSFKKVWKILLSSKLTIICIEMTIAVSLI